MTKTIFVVIIIVLISIPLLHSLVTIKEKIKISNKTSIYLENILKQKSEYSKIKELIVEKIDDDSIKISSIISVPE
jgi:hypothetical protein